MNPILVSFALDRLKLIWNDGKHLPMLSAEFNEDLASYGLKLLFIAQFEGDICIETVIDRRDVDRHVWADENSLSGFLFRLLEQSMEPPLKGGRW